MKNNPLAQRKSGNRTNLLREENGQSIILNQRTLNLNINVIENTDFSDLMYVNRIINTITDIENDSDFGELCISIESIGLINPIYLQVRDDGKYRIVSGLRRMVASKKILEEGKKIKAKEKIIIIPESADLTLLDKISIDENAKRKNLTIMELSWKFNQDAKEKGKSIEQLMNDYGFSKRHTLRIKKAIDYPIEIQEIIDTLGPEKAELLNRLIILLKTSMKTQKIINKYKDFTREELREIVKNLKKDKSNNIDFKSSRNKSIITLRNEFNLKKELSPEAKKEIETFFLSLKQKYDL
ncbi:MAG: hypothetical protein B6I28_03465 [Fusobacteriia bacterium 4572_132]|nr:MAG: hypothetical protein B6I28_03465 [Fusobacteriia bacterium 4572_132]